MKLLLNHHDFACYSNIHKSQCHIHHFVCSRKQWPRGPLVSKSIPSSTMFGYHSEIADQERELMVWALYVRAGCVARHATPQTLGFPPGWPRPQFPGLCHLPLRLGVGGLRAGTPRPLAQGNESRDGRSGRATGG